MSTPDDMSPDDLLAMDYALGALGRTERKAAEVRLRSDPGFRALVEGWQATLAPLDDEVAAVAPPPAVWAAIAAEITPPPRVAAAPAPAPQQLPARGWWHNLALWRGLAVGGPVAAALAVVAISTPGSEVAPQANVPAAVPAGDRLVATLAGADGKPLLAAAYDPASGAVAFAPVAAPDGEAGKVPELWVIEGKNPPRSLGVIDISRGQTHSIPRERLQGLKAGAVLAISIEPIGGSPTGAPTGPVVATGALTAA